MTPNDNVHIYILIIMFLYVTHTVLIWVSLLLVILKYEVIFIPSFFTLTLQFQQE